MYTSTSQISLNRHVRNSVFGDLRNPPNFPSPPCCVECRREELEESLNEALGALEAERTVHSTTKEEMEKVTALRSCRDNGVTTLVPAAAPSSGALAFQADKTGRTCIRFTAESTSEGLIFDVWLILLLAGAFRL